MGLGLPVPDAGTADSRRAVATLAVTVPVTPVARTSSRPMTFASATSSHYRKFDGVTELESEGRRRSILPGSGGSLDRQDQPPPAPTGQSIHRNGHGPVAGGASSSHLSVSVNASHRQHGG